MSSTPLFTNTDRQSATPRPGLYIARSWPLAEAEKLDNDASRLTGEVSDVLGQLLKVLRASAWTD